MEPKTVLEIMLAAGIVAAVGGVGCSFAADDQAEATNDAVTTGGDVSQVLKSTLQLEGCTAAKVGPRQLLVAARCVSGNATFKAGNSISFTTAALGKVATANPTKPTPAGSCTALATCCATIKSAGNDSSVCEAAAAKKDEPACAKAQEGYQTFGDCVPPAGPQCTALATCCATIKGAGNDSSVCEAAAAKKDEQACTKAQDGYQTYGDCVPPPPAAKPASNPNAKTVTIASVVIHPSYVAKCTGDLCDFTKLAASGAADIAVILLEKDLDGIPTVPVDLDPVREADSLLVVTSGCTTFDAAPAAPKTVQTQAVPAKSANHAGSPYETSPSFVGSLASSYVVTAAGGWKTGKPRLCRTDIGAPLFRASTAAVAGVTSNYTTFLGQSVPVTTEHTRVDAQSSFKIGQWLTKLGAETIHSCSESADGCGERSTDPTPPKSDGGIADAATTPDAAPDAAAAPAPVADPSPQDQDQDQGGNNDPPTSSKGSSSKADAPASKKEAAAEGGCSAAPGTTPSGGLVIGLALALGAMLARRRRSRPEPRKILRAVS
jgi:hypothetical protein